MYDYSLDIDVMITHLEVQLPETIRELFRMECMYVDSLLRDRLGMTHVLFPRGPICRLLASVMGRAYQEGKWDGEREQFAAHEKAMGPWIGALLGGALVPGAEADTQRFLKNHDPAYAEGAPK